MMRQMTKVAMTPVGMLPSALVVVAPHVAFVVLVQSSSRVPTSVKRMLGVIMGTVKALINSRVADSGKPVLVCGSRSRLCRTPRLGVRLGVG